MTTKFTTDHEWINIEDHDAAVVGITLHAQDALGDVVFVDLPEVGRSYAQGEVAGVVRMQSRPVPGVAVFLWPVQEVVRRSLGANASDVDRHGRALPIREFARRRLPHSRQLRRERDG